MKITDREKIYQRFANSAALRNFSNSAALNVWYNSERISLITKALEIAQKAVNKEHIILASNFLDLNRDKVNAFTNNLNFQRNVAKVMFDSQIVRSFETLKEIADFQTFSHLNYIISKADSFDNDIPIIIDEDNQIDINSENMKELSKDIQDIYPNLTSEENIKFTIIIYILITVHFLLTLSDEKDLSNISKFLFSFRPIVQKAVLDFSSSALDSLKPENLGSQFGTFVSGFLASVLSEKTKKIIKQKKKKKKKKRRK